MRNSFKPLLSALLCFTMLSGCGTKASGHEAAAAGIQALKNRGIPAGRAGLNTPFLPVAKALSSETLSTTENTKQTDSKVTASISSSHKSTADRPHAEDFEWISGVKSVYDVPEGAKVLNRASEISGDWKVMLIGADNDYYSFYSILNMNFDFESNNEDVHVTADWYRSSEINKQTGEGKAYDESQDADTVYNGSLINGTIYVFDPTDDPYSRYLFVSGDRLLCFFIENLYETGGKQYGLGTFYSEDDWLGTIALVRSARTSKTGVPAKAQDNSNVKWKQFEGYWAAEYENDPEDLWDDERYSVYIESDGPEYVLCYISDEMWGKNQYGRKRAVYDEASQTLTLYKLENDEYQTDYQLDQIKGRDCIYVAGEKDAPFFRADKSERDDSKWAEIETLFAELREQK